MGDLWRHRVEAEKQVEVGLEARLSEALRRVESAEEPSLFLGEREREESAGQEGGGVSPELRHQSQF